MKTKLNLMLALIILYTGIGKSVTNAQTNQDKLFTLGMRVTSVLTPDCPCCASFDCDQNNYGSKPYLNASGPTGTKYGTVNCLTPGVKYKYSNGPSAFVGECPLYLGSPGQWKTEMGVYRVSDEGTLDDATAKSVMDSLKSINDEISNVTNQIQNDINAEYNNLRSMNKSLENYNEAYTTGLNLTISAEKDMQDFMKLRNYINELNRMILKLLNEKNQ